MTAETVKVLLNQQQLELLDNTVARGIAPDRAAATGRLDQAPVDVSITTATVRNVLAVPVNALVALASGGYAVEEVESSGVHQLVGVSA